MSRLEHPFNWFIPWSWIVLFFTDLNCFKNYCEFQINGDTNELFTYKRDYSTTVVLINQKQYSIQLEFSVPRPSFQHHLGLDKNVNSLGPELVSWRRWEGRIHILQILQVILLHAQIENLCFTEWYISSSSEIMASFQHHKF